MGALEDKKFQMVVGGVTITGGLYVAVKLSWFRKNPLHSFGGKTGSDGRRAWWTVGSNLTTSSSIKKMARVWDRAFFPLQIL